MSKIEVNTVDTQCGSTLTLGSSGKTVTLACGATQSGFGRTGTVDWCTTAKTGPLTAVSGKGYFINTTGGAITVTLPSSPTAGDIVSVKDYAGTFGTACKELNIARGGSKIGGICGCATISTANESLTLVYVDGTKGWMTVQETTTATTGSQLVSATGGNAVVTNGDYKTHIFTAAGTFCVSAGAGPLAVVEYFVIGAGGGGGGGPSPSGGQGGAGAGGFRMYTTAPGSNSPLNHPSNAIPVTVQGYPIAVGAGGTAGTNSPPAASNQGGTGAVSTFSTITSAGGGGGGSSSTDNPNFPPTSCGSGHCGASGSGTAYQNPGHSGFGGGLGNKPPTSPPQGNNGGASAMPGASSYPGSGGGGAGGAGTNGGPGPAGQGGIGSYVADPFIGPTAPSYGTPGPVSSTRYFAGGGGGGGNPVPAVLSGGGGAGGTNPAAGSAATANTGGGGGGGGKNSGGTGGSGFVAIRYKFQ